jgi:hypothetical protein
MSPKRSLGDIVFDPFLLLPKVYPTHFSATTERKSMKHHRLFLLLLMATAAKFVQPIPNFLAYLVPLDVDVVHCKFHQFLFGE